MSDLQRIEKDITALIHDMTLTEVRSNEDYDYLTAWLRKNKDTQKIVNDFFEPARAEAKKAYDSVLEQKKAFIKPLEEAEKIARAKMSVFATAQEAARKQAEAERLELEKKEAAALMAGDSEAYIDAALAQRPDQVAKVGKVREVVEIEVEDWKAFLLYVSGFKTMYTSLELKKSDFMMALKVENIKPENVPGLKCTVKVVPVL